MKSRRPAAASRSLAVYRLLLQLYPQPYLRRHRAELLQNFEDLEQASQSNIALWLFLGRDLIVSLPSQYIPTLSGQTAIVVIVLAALLASAKLRAGTQERPVEGFCYGYILGWFAGWFGKLWQVSPVSRLPSLIRSLPVQAATVVITLFFVVACMEIGSGRKSHLIWALCYGFLLAWLAGWAGKRWQVRS